MSDNHGTDFKRVARIMRPRFEAEIAAGGARCIDCGKSITPGQAFAIGHIVSVAEAKASGWPPEAIHDPSNLGPTHHGTGRGLNCNTSQGGKLGRSIQTTTRKQDQRFLNW
jgi:hypothetical protein